MEGLTPHEQDLALNGGRAAEVIGGLGSFAAFLAAHPGLPLDGDDPLHYCARSGTDEDERAEVDRIAGILGVTPRPLGDSGTHYQAARDFGGGLVYTATAISAGYMAEHEANSYYGAVKPESLVAA